MVVVTLGASRMLAGCPSNTLLDPFRFWPFFVWADSDRDTRMSNDTYRIFRIFNLHILKLRHNVLYRIASVLKGVRDQRRKPIPHQKALPIGFGLGDQRQEQIPMFRQNFVDAQDLQRSSHIEHFGNRGRFLQAPTAKRPRQPRDLCMNMDMAAFDVKRENLPFPIDRGMIESNVQTSPEQWRSNSAFLVGSEYGEGDSPGTDGPKLGNGQLPVAKELEEQRLELVVDFVDFIHEEDAAIRFIE